MYTMDGIEVFAAFVGIVTVLTLLLAPIVIIVGLVETYVLRKPVFHDPDNRVYFARNHSIGYRIMARFLYFGLYIVVIPELVIFFLVRVCPDITIVIIALMLSEILGMIFFGLSFIKKLTNKVDRIVVDRSGMRVYYRKKKLKDSFYPIGSFVGYDQKCNLLFADRSGSSYYVNTKYISKKYTIALGNDLIAMATGKYMNTVPDTLPKAKTYVSDYAKQEVPAEVTKIEKVEEKKPVKEIYSPLIDTGSSILESYGTSNINAPGSILGDYGPLKTEDNLGLISGTETHIEEASKGNLKEVSDKEETKAEAPDISSNKSRIFIKNSYLTDIDKKTVSFNSSRDEDQRLEAKSSHFPGSSWMYVDIKRCSAADPLEFFLSCMNLMTELSDLSKDIFFYAEDDIAAYIDGNKIKCRRAGKSYIFDPDKLELIPVEEDNTSDADIKAFIKRKFYLDV